MKPRLAFFSPLPPKCSGISDYSFWLLEELKKHYAIDLYHDSGYRPKLGESWHEFGCYDYRVFGRRAGLVNYRGIVYQMGNSHYHKFVYDTLLVHPGIVTLHDFCLADFHTWYASLPDTFAEYWRRELEHCSPKRVSALWPLLDNKTNRREEIVDACMRLGIAVNRRVFEHAKAIIVHDAWCIRQIEALLPEYLDRCAVIPHGAKV
jgi:hypothetical protein